MAGVVPGRRDGSSMSNSSDQDSGPGLSYRDAGVDIDAGSRLVERIAPAVARTRRSEVMNGLGGFGGLFRFPREAYRNPVLVATTDGVGTKLKLAVQAGRNADVGIDLVAMCVNDLVVQGAEPLFFLDYFASGRLDVGVAAEVVGGIARGCEIAGCALIGGETAEMPGVYQDGDYDLAGFSVGVVEADSLIDGSRVEPGDALIGIASSGPHSNGFSLIRKVLEQSGTPLTQHLGDVPLADALLAPTRIYVQALQLLSGAADVRALAHITGGGLPENLPRVLPDQTVAAIEPGSWPVPPVFDWLARTGNIAWPEMYRTFNCGVGMVACVPADQAEEAIDALAAGGETAWRIGTVETGAPGPARVRLGS